MAEFHRLGIQSWLSNQCTYMALESPTPIQRECIPAILADHHVVGGAATGSGKTAAFALPILQKLAVDAYGVFAVVLTPSRELAYQIIDQFIAFGAPLQVRTMLAIGGVPTETQVDALKARPHIVAATPGRLRHLLEAFAPEVKKAFTHLRYLVLDEADRLTEGDIVHDVRALLRLLPPTPQRRVLMFTATLHPRLTTLEASPANECPLAGGAEPKQGERKALESPSSPRPPKCSDGQGTGDFSVLAELGITDPASLKVAVVRGAIQEGVGDVSAGAACGSLGNATALTQPGNATVYHLPELLIQNYLFIPNIVKLPYLVAALRAQGKNQSTIVYVNSCLRAELVRLTLQLLGFPVCSLDSLLTQQHRLDNVASFKLGIARILVCTDIAARGLDIPAVSLVLHYDVPKHADTYVHRVGRTARAGREGTSVAFVTEYDVGLVQRIEKKIHGTLTLWKSPAAKESAILSLLDEVSAAKVQAKQQVTEQFGARAQTHKAHAAQKKEARAQSQAMARAARSSSSSQKLDQKQPLDLRRTEANGIPPTADTVVIPSKSLRKRSRTSDTTANDTPTQADVAAAKQMETTTKHARNSTPITLKKKEPPQQPITKNSTVPKYARMLNERVPCGDTFNNSYTSSTLVGNWLEDRLQERIVQTGRRRVGTTWCAKGLYEDPAVTKARNPAAVQADLLHSTYEVDYGNCLGASQPNANGGSPSSGVGATLMLGSSHTAHGMASARASPTALRGIDKVLLFSVDPVADPAAPMPASSYTDTYGVFYFRRPGGSSSGDSNGGRKGRHGRSTIDTATSSSPEGRLDGEAAASIGEADRNLYDSVLRATAAAAATSPLLSFLPRSAYMPGSAKSGGTSLPPVPQRHRLSRGLPAANALGSTGWTLASSSTTLPVCGVAGEVTMGSRRKHYRSQKDNMDKERWCSSKQAADTPVEHFTLQRRLPPAWL